MTALASPTTAPATACSSVSRTCRRSDYATIFFRGESTFIKREQMGRLGLLALTTSAAVAWSAAVGTPTARADPAKPCHVRSPNCAVVPGMKDGVIGQPCSNWTRYTYGFGPSGEILACRSFDGGNSGQWAQGGSPTGVREIGTPCSSRVGRSAKPPDGRPLWCLTQGPYHPSGDPTHPDGTWDGLPKVQSLALAFHVLKTQLRMEGLDRAMAPSSEKAESQPTTTSSHR